MSHVLVTIRFDGDADELSRSGSARLSFGRRSSRQQAPLQWWRRGRAVVCSS